MKNSIRFLAAMLALILALSLGLSGCAPIFKDKAPENGDDGVIVTGGQANVDSEGKPFETVYVAGLFDFDRSFSASSQITSSPNGLYVYDDSAKILYEFDADGHFLRELGDVQPDWIAPDGSGWRLDYSEDPNDRHIDYTVSRVNGDNKTQLLAFRTERETANLTVGDGFFLITKQWWDESNTGHYSMDTYDFSGNLLHSQDLGEWFKIFPGGDDIYFVGRESYDIFRYDKQNYMINKVDAVDEDCEVCGIYGNSLYLTDQVCVYRREIGCRERESLFRFDTLYISERLVPISIGNSRSFFFYDNLNEVSPYRLAYPVDESSIPAERKAVVIAINDESIEYFNNPYGEYRDVILDFNTVNQEYEVIVKNYYECPDPQMALNADIAGGNVPDIIDMAGFSGGMVSSANAENLLPWFERDYGTDGLLQGPLQAMLTDGRLLSFIPSFGVTTILGPASLLNGQKVNSFSDLSTLAGDAEHVFYNSVDRDTLMYLAFANSKRDYTAIQIADILTFAASLPSGYREQDPFFDPIQAGEQRFELATVTSPLGSMEPYKGLAWEEGNFGERLAALGLPCSNGTGILLTPTQELMMPLGAENKEGAWEFIKFMLNDRYLVDLVYGRGFRNGIPITRSAFERGLEGCWQKMNGILTGYENGMDYTLHYDVENCKTLFQKIIDDVDGVLRGEDEIYFTVAELAQSYFAGDRSLDQVSADIASRLKMYHAERG